MNAHALLTSQGWRGTGNSLGADNSIGLSKPLLVSKKVDNLGIGKKQHRTSDMWWMNAFDSSLKGLDTSKEGVVTQTVTSGGLDMVAKGGAKWVGSKGGLYASFVRGDVLGGTIQRVEEKTEGSGDPAKKKRKRNVDEGVVVEGKESKEERRARKTVKLAQKVKEISTEESIKSTASTKSEEKPESKGERKARRAAKKASKVKNTIREEMENDEAANKDRSETKEERKARKAAKKALKSPIPEESMEERKDLKRPRKLGEGKQAGAYLEKSTIKKKRKV